MTEHPPSPDERPDEDGEPLTGEPINPAAMRLRAEPPRVTRLSRRVLATIGLAASLGVGGALVYALQTRHAVHEPEDQYSTENRPTADGVAALPRDYATVPKLGPPLPGDLGKPILSAQQRGQEIPAAGTTGAPGSAPRVSPERQRRFQEIESARTARLFATSEARGAEAPPVSSGVLDSGTGAAAAPPNAPPTAQDRQAAFLDAAPERRTVSTESG